VEGSSGDENGVLGHDCGAGGRLCYSFGLEVRGIRGLSRMVN
jgi:hypothetical protein